MTKQSGGRASRTFDALLDCVLTHDMAGYAELFAPDGTMEFPFATDGSPSRLEGREAIAQYVADYNKIVLPRQVVLDRRHHTGDPDAIVVEFAVSGEVVATGEPYQLDYVAVVRVTDDGIALYRDYWSPDAVQQVMARQNLAGGAS